MLGEINLEPWQCVAELIDNSIDPFIKAANAGIDPLQCEISVHLPTRDDEGARVTITDNGPGMTSEELENAVRAGWTGNDPLGNLGLFGMGFNIATARLGTITQVWTTRESDDSWWGIEIDLDRLRRRRSFRTPVLRRAKADPVEHGTEVSVLKTEARAERLDQQAKESHLDYSMPREGLRGNVAERRHTGLRASLHRQGLLCGDSGTACGAIWAVLLGRPRIRISVKSTPTRRSKSTSVKGGTAPTVGFGSVPMTRLVPLATRVRT